MTQPPATGGRGVACTWIDADIDDHGRAVADNDGLGRRRNGEAAPAAPTPAADEKLDSAKAVEAEALEVIVAEAVKPVRAEAVEAKPAGLKAPVEAARRKMGKMTASKSRTSARPPARPCGRTKARGQERRRAWPGRRRALPSSLGKYAWE